MDEYIELVRYLKSCKMEGPGPEVHKTVSQLTEKVAKLNGLLSHISSVSLGLGGFETHAGRKGREGRSPFMHGPAMVGCTRAYFSEVHALQQEDF